MAMRKCVTSEVRALELMLRDPDPFAMCAPSSETKLEPHLWTVHNPKPLLLHLRRQLLMRAGPTMRS